MNFTQQMISHSAEKQKQPERMRLLIRWDLRHPGSRIIMRILQM